jgi:hypothetical protein
MAFNIPPPTDTTNMFGDWLNVVYKKDKGHNKVGVLFIMTIWKV